MIIIIAIIALASSVTISLTGQLSFARTQRATKTINITLDKLRMETMSKGISYKMYLYLAESDLYMKILKDGDTITLTKDNGEKLSVDCQVRYKREGIAEEILEEGVGKYIAISFSKSSGAFTSNYEWVSISNAKHTSILQFVRETGKHWIE
jgi:hypothetical protein